MNRIRKAAFFAAAVVAGLAIAATTLTSESWNVYKGTAIIKPRVDYKDRAACLASIASQPDGVYQCVGRITVSKVSPPPPPVVWAQVAAEGKPFTLATDSVVRFIYHGWEEVGTVAISKTLTAGAHTCRLSEFDLPNLPAKDPKEGNAKVCEVGSGTPPVVAPADPPASSPVIDPPPPKPADPPASTPVNDMPKATTVNASLIPKLVQNPVGGWSKDMLISTTEVAPSSDIGAFRTGCQVAKYAFDDPIVFPGQPGKSHLHTIFGNTGFDAYSTAESLATTGNSTCRGGTINRSAYWVPSMIDTRTGAPLAPMFESNFYYKTGYALPPTLIKPMPAGLRIIAGDPKGSPTAPSSAAIYACVWDGGNSNWSSSIPTDCPATSNSWLIMGIDFPQCWDGVNLDSPDHKSHMANPVNVKANNTGNCPSTHPVAIPQIAFQVLYQVRVTGETKYWRLSSDAYDATKPAGFSGHGDWFNGWKQDIVEVWVKNCDNAQKDCHSHLLGDGRQMVIP